MPSAQELQAEPYERADPIGDHTHSAGRGHRAPLSDRVLLKLVHVCAVYCRSASAARWSGRARIPRCRTLPVLKAMDYIRTHPEIWEVILTGGDPLMLSARRLKEIVADLAAIPHVKIVRFHTRVPVADPAR